MQQASMSIQPKTVSQDYSFEEVTVLTTEISVPTFAGLPLPAMKRLNRFYEFLLTEQTRYAKKTLLPAAIKDYKLRVKNQIDFPGYNLTVDYSVLLAVFDSDKTENCKLSLTYDVYEYTGGAHGNTLRYADNFSTMTGYPLPPLIQGRAARRSAIDQCIAIAQAQQAAGEQYYFDDIPGNMRRYFRENQVNLLENGLLRVFYQQYTLAPYVSGILSFDIHDI